MTITTLTQLSIPKINAGATGDTFILADGTYDHASREAITKSVIVKAQNKGKAIIKGAPIDLKAQSITFQDFNLQYNAGSEQTVVGIYNPDCKFIGNTCGFANPITGRQDWFNIKTDNCLFQGNDVFGKTSMGNMVLVGVGSFIAKSNKILGNHFHDQKGGSGNGAEMIRFGSSEVALADFNTEFANNILENHDTSDTELITVKSSSNDLHDNTINNCHASPTLRHGRNNKFRNNKINGCGLRIYGKDHTVTGNTFTRNPLNQLRQVVIGNGDFAEDALIGVSNSRHSQVRNLTFDNNWIDGQDSTTLVLFALGENSGYGFKPIGNRITNNKILASTGTLASSMDGATWDGNTVSGNILWATGTAKYGDMPSSGYTKQDPNAPPTPIPLTIEQRVQALETDMIAVKQKLGL